MKHTFTLFMLVIFAFTQAQQKHTVYFDFDMDEANSSSVTRLDSWMSQNKNAVIEKVYGYADSKGSNDYNVDLSQRRAYYVVNKLKENGVTVNVSVEIKAFGDDFEQDKDQAKNRKVEIYYTLNDEVRPEPKPDEPESYEYEFSQRIKVSRVGDKFKLDNLNFYGGTADLLPESRPMLAELLKVMKENPNLKIEIQGHVCCNLNKDHPLSKQRAITVYTYLQVHGIDTSRISYKNFGGSSPIYKIPEMTEREKTANRRVEIEIIAN